MAQIEDLDINTIPLYSQDWHRDHLQPLFNAVNQLIADYNERHNVAPENTGGGRKKKRRRKRRTRKRRKY